jgi:ElaB/YqjD/DUF883 family membrane-anchored ribosome-binding protein
MNPPHSPARYCAVSMGLAASLDERCAEMRILDLQTITSDIASLKHDFAALTYHLKPAASEKARTAAQSALEQISDKALRAYENLTTKGKCSVKAIGRQVEEQPLISLLLAFAVGFLGGRMLSR